MTHTQRQRHRQREKQAPCREPDMGLDPGSPGSNPGLQAALNRCATGVAPLLEFLLGLINLGRIDILTVMILLFIFF